MTTKEKRAVGRPTTYSLEIAEEICERLSTSKLGLERICDAADMPSKSAVWRWLVKHAEFREMYVRSREFQSEVMYDDLLVIPNLPLTHNGEEVEDGGIPLAGPAALAEIQRRRLICDNIKFILAKLQVKRFGDNKNIDLNVNHNHKISSEQFNQLLATAAAPPQIAAPEDADDNKGYIEFTETQDSHQDRDDDMAGMTADRFDELIDEDDLG